MEKPREIPPQSKFKNEYCDLVKDFMKDGSSFVAFAGHVGVCRDTLYHWRKIYPEFDEACRIAKDLCQAWWEDQGKHGLFMGKDDGSFSQASWIFNMKARFGWRDKVDVEQKSEQTIKLAYNLDEDPEE